MAGDDFGILISAPGTSVANASQAQLLMNTSNPFLKIDTQNPVGFQTITLLITTNPPEPVGPSWANTYTTLYKFKHGYDYIPTVEMLCYVQTPPPDAPSAAVMTYFQDWGMIDAHTEGDDGCYIYTIVDATYVYIICEKFNDGSGMPSLLSGTNLLISLHVFVESGTY
jgi:hypothetical protein